MCNIMMYNIILTVIPYHVNTKILASVFLLTVSKQADRFMLNFILFGFVSVSTYLHVPDSEKAVCPPFMVIKLTISKS